MTKIDTKEPSKLEKITASVAGAVIATEYLLCYNNFNGLHKSAMHNHDKIRLFPMTESYFGDTPEIFSAVLADRNYDYGRSC